MALAEFIKKKLRKFKLQIEDDELTVKLAELGGNPEGELTPSSMLIAKQVFVSVIPELLLEPDISQGDFSRKYNMDGIRTYYSMLCDELGVENKLAPQPKVYDASNRW
ncbi:DUF6706 family protein [Parapedobacter indicus]|uniref:Uncharacterized protein n=1 Tax=Parapedobacter indicus TaxID=1477437 RepID=A0A1I3E521_9SPHI|nr:DUF6706 family protein [Parapedobacter indicus]PPL04973.1 hypothetical protein CLV26_101784 [Parapedobacter indicus]SFH94122.1 hypothetical protein SAMN05444682_101770 [Parapedobacter indicus]